MVMVVRNEARFLAANLLYHRAVGVRRAYVYLDRCTDGSEQIAASFPWVKATRVAPEDGARFACVPDLQVACMDRALEDARKEGFDWLLMLDADEFAVADNPSPKGRAEHSECARGDLVRLLEKVRRSTDVVQLTTRELLPLDLEPDEPFWRQQYFSLAPDYCREILDPADGAVKLLRGYLGHAYGKSIVRTSADVQAFNPHEWTRHQGVRYPDLPGRGRLRVENRGIHLHFVVVDWLQWLDKNRKFHHEPGKWRMGGEVPFPKQCWKEAAPRFSEDEAREYFRGWVACTELHLQNLVKAGSVIHDGIVEKTLRESGALRGTTLQLPPEVRLDSIEDWKLPESFWREGPHGVERRPDGGVRFRLADLSTDRIDGLYGPFFDGRERYRWAKANADVSFDLPPADYSMTMHLPRWSAGSVSISIDGRKVHDRVVRGRQQALTVSLSRHDFAATDQHRLRVQFHRTMWQRLLGRPASAGISEISFQPLQRAA